VRRFAPHLPPGYLLSTPLALMRTCESVHAFGAHAYLRVCPSPSALTYACESVRLRRSCSKPHSRAASLLFQMISQRALQVLAVDFFDQVKLRDVDAAHLPARDLR
jgi:hypothetical protein